MASARPIQPKPDPIPAGGAASGANAERITPLRELQLLEQHRAGGPGAPDALAELLGAYQRRVFSVCARMVRNPDDAADLTHDALIRVIEGLPSYNGQSKLSTWVIRVTMNCCLTFLRKQKLRKHESLDSRSSRSGQTGGTGSATPAGGRTGSKTGFSDPSPGGSAAAREPWPGQRIEQEQTRELILKAMDDLDADMRAILVLRDVQDLDYQQLAEVLEIPIGTVKSRLFRARAALRHSIEVRGGI